MKMSWAYKGACALLLSLWALLIVGSRRLSLSWDEPAHILAGYIFLARRMQELWYFFSYLHPPLLNSVEALLLFLSQPGVPLETLAGWGGHYTAYVHSFVPYLAPVERTAVLARTPVVLMTMLLGALVFRWGKEIGGGGVGLAALALMTFDPNMLANGRLATTDVGTVTLGTAALYTTWRWIRQPAWRWTAATGGLLGLTMLAKFSGLLWVAACGLLALGAVFLCWRSEGPRRLLQAATAGVLAGLAVWAVFGFSFGLTSLLPVPLPAPDYWTGFVNLMAESTGRLVIAFGRVYSGQQWWFLPLSFVFRNPIPLLVALPIGLWVFIRRGVACPRLLTLAIFPCLYVLASIVGGMSMSYRHMLPAHPFLYLIAAIGVWAIACRRSLWVYLILATLGGWYIAGTLQIFPDELTYSNELVGGPDNGYRYLLADTQDWGQAYKELRAYLAIHPGPEPQVFHFTFIPPDFYGVAHRDLQHVTPFYPQPGRYVLGTAPLYGLVGPDPMQFNWFRLASPTAIIGHSLFVYDVIDQPAWVSQCITPVLPLDDTAVTEGFGAIGLRRADFDCTRAWLYPGDVRVGVYAFHHALLLERDCRFFPLRCEPLAADPFITRHLAGTRLAYEQERFGLLPAFTLYERGGPPPLPVFLPARVAPASTSPAALVSSATHVTPSLDGPLAFLGAVIYPDGSGLDAETWWQVTEGAITRPFSIMAHLLTPEGEVLGVADGLGVLPPALAVGDVVVQRHYFPTIPGSEGLWLRTGAYWLDTLERWAVIGAPGSDALFVSLGQDSYR